MVQNANGPCPLLALVNALVLSTPSDLATVLVETLRVREQVSLGLLLDAVIDELMSGRRGDAAQNLPDVSELYAFLVNLHTGMNVNPQFVILEEGEIHLLDAPIDSPANTAQARRAGGFEDTKEMKLYSTFAVPLIHGWVPPRSHPAFAALKRTGKSYEDAQNVMFREEELEEKLRGQGLSAEEQALLEDIASIKYYLTSTATQLTGYGLDTITESLTPGAIVILFRNDHFSTLYRHPKSGQLLTLVTDMGYAGHDEVVWESLVDVNGEGSEFYAGDFRPIGNITKNTQSQMDSAEGWETVTSKNSRKNTQANGSNASQAPSSSFGNLTLDETTSPSKNTEQEDHDLALAMQLQEEEEDHQRRSAAARRREDELSQTYLNNADASGRRTFPGFGRGATGGGVEGGSPQVPPRRSGGAAAAPRAAGSARLAPERQSDSEDAPPPSYEQAAKGPAYHPPVDHPAHPHASPSPPPGAGAAGWPLAGRTRADSSAYTEHAASSYGGLPSSGQRRRGRRPSGVSEALPPGVMRRRTGDMVGLPAAEREAKDRDCVVM